jgi:hypothetical protein
MVTFSNTKFVAGTMSPVREGTLDLALTMIAVISAHRLWTKSC